MWLLGNQEPAARALTLTAVLGYPASHPEPVAARKSFSSGPVAAALLRDGGEHVYGKWRGAFWRLTALAPHGWPTRARLTGIACSGTVRSR
jgi:hypothetical protein